MEKINQAVRIHSYGGPEQVRVEQVAMPEIAQRTPAARTGLWFQMHPDAQLLATLAAMVVRGEIKVEVSRLFQLDNVQQAIDYGYSGRGRGKAVLEF
ncbi:MAG: zinc-binding dehydrogenase family protein [Collimonas fungivorans]|uniref:zinc-binding dehydrogenase n=1 Tax=Collimonas fungivorans TaxID=158899 RepID=UPI0026EA1C91|nr:zinc-binding dehydrogenase [Collimonas fungivorans]MDB5768813.1 zinc-binding dehydrogenase family protein [Collimonas fungivorans]